MQASNQKKIIILVVAAAILVGAVLFLRQKPAEGTPATQNQTGSSLPEVATTTEKGGVFTVMIQGYKFIPDVLPPVKRGDIIDFVNVDPVVHHVYAKGFFGPYTIAAKSGLFELDTSKLVPGTYTYVCDIHPGMTGTFTVR